MHKQFFGDGIYLSSYVLGPSTYLTSGAGSTLWHVPLTSHWYSCFAGASQSLYQLQSLPLRCEYLFIHIVDEGLTSMRPTTVNVIQSTQLLLIKVSIHSSQSGMLTSILFPSSFWCTSPLSGRVDRLSFGSHSNPSWTTACAMHCKKHW